MSGLNNRLLCLGLGHVMWHNWLVVWHHRFVVWHHWLMVRHHRFVVWHHWLVMAKLGVCVLRVRFGATSAGKAGVVVIMHTFVCHWQIKVGIVALHAAHLVEGCLTIAKGGIRILPVIEITLLRIGRTVVWLAAHLFAIAEIGLLLTA